MLIYVDYKNDVNFLWIEHELPFLYFRAIEWYWLWIFDRVIGHLRIHTLDNRMREPICRMLKINVCKIEIVRRKFHNFSSLGYKDFYSNILINVLAKKYWLLDSSAGSCWKMWSVCNNVYLFFFLLAKFCIRLYWQELSSPMYRITTKSRKLKMFIQRIWISRIIFSSHYSCKTICPWLILCIRLDSLMQNNISSLQNFWWNNKYANFTLAFTKRIFHTLHFSLSISHF